MKKGFSLAEVLITLGVIGVVAAITIPTLVSNYQKSQYVTGLKKAYTTFNQALNHMATDEGCTGDLACTGIFDTSNSNVGQTLVKYFSVVQDCGKNFTLECWPQKTLSHYDGSTPAQWTNINSFGGYTFITQDGMSFYISKYDTGNCIAQNGNLTKMCGTVIVDVNGLKNPNYYGRDTFSFLIINDKGPALYPNGGQAMASGSGAWNNSGSGNCGLAGGTNGQLCAGRIIEEGWQMNY